VPVTSFEPLGFLARHGLADPQGLTAAPLQGGYQNQVFRVRGPKVDWVVKQFHPAAEITMFPNDAVTESFALKRLAPHGVAPRPVAFIEDEDKPVLVYEFYPGRPWSGDLAAVAGLLRRLMRIDVEGFRQVSITPDELLAQGDLFARHTPAAARGRLLAARPQPIEVAPVRRRLVHTDFGPGNLIEGADGLIAIDWQCPAAGDPAEDLTAFLSPAFQILYGRAPLTAAQEQALLAAHGDPETLDRLRHMRRFFDWRMAAYCVMRQYNLASTRPAASESYRQATNALLETFEAHA